MTYFIFDHPLWPYLFVFIAGSLTTYLCRWAGLIFAERINEESDIFLFLNYASIALIAGILAYLVIYPQGSFAQLDLIIRMIPIAVGTAIYLVIGRSMLAGLAVSVLCLISLQVLL